ncbi:MAG: protein kinase [Planctomycetota bacterium]|nr:protein kinase [Planctomycetota bacterium]
MAALGDRLDGKYLVIDRLGEGGFGEVFLAEDEAIPGRRVAIKVLHSAAEDDQHNLVWEMRQLSQISHPHVVGFYHHFIEDAHLHLVMEFCAKGGLDERLAAVGAFPEIQVFEWALQLCSALAFVHNKGIVQHDVKPQNILFANDGTIKLGDFGVANSNAGTLPFLPPEVLLHERVSRTDPRVDVYALGLTLIQLLTGQHPLFGVSTEEAIEIRIRHDFVSASLSQWVQGVLLKATHPTPELRFQSVSDFAHAIRAQHVPFIVDLNRIKADKLAGKAESFIRRGRWRKAEEQVRYALECSPDCVSALMAAGHCKLLIRQADRAYEYFSHAVRVSPRTPVQKELAEISLERGNIPKAISLLTDHLQRNASDYEAYNLLLKCFYVTHRLDAGMELAEALKNESPSNCFTNNMLLFRLLNGRVTSVELNTLVGTDQADPFFAYNLNVFNSENWQSNDSQPPLKSKLLFQEYRFGVRSRSKSNVLSINLPDGRREEFSQPIVTIGSLSSNDLPLEYRGVSRRHCVIVNRTDDVWIYDLKSTVGTVVDGERLLGGMHLAGVHNVDLSEACLRIGASRDLLV